MKMKKIALAVACLTSLPVMAADDEKNFSFYGSLRVMVEEAEYTNFEEGAFGDGNGNIVDGLSRAGVKGSHDLGNGLSAFGHYEQALDVANGEFNNRYGSENARIAKVGLSGDFGTIAAGKMWSTYYLAVAWPGDNTIYSSVPVFYHMEESADNSWGYKFRIGQSVMYTTPMINGVQGSLLYSEQEDETQLGIWFNPTDKVRVGIGAIADHDLGNDKYGISARYNGEGYWVYGSYQDYDNVGEGIDLGVGMTSGDTTYMFEYGAYDDANSSDEDFDIYLFAVHHNIRPAVKLFAEYRTWDGAAQSFEFSAEGDNVDSNVLRVGLQYDF